MSNVRARLHSVLPGNYRVERELGRGGMATVWLAHDLKHDRDVAIKVIHPELAAALGGDRFLQEIRIAAHLQHPHILTLIDSGSTAADPGETDSLYYVMPYVEGETLRRRLERESRLSPQAVRILQDIFDALAHAHRQGIDFFFPYETSSLPMFRLLGTPPDQKRYVLENGSHFVPRTRLIQETLAWFDKYQPVR